MNHETRQTLETKGILHSHPKAGGARNPRSRESEFRIECVNRVALSVDRLILTPELTLRSHECVRARPDTAVSQTTCFLLPLLVCKALKWTPSTTQTGAMGFWALRDHLWVNKVRLTAGTGWAWLTTWTGGMDLLGGLSGTPRHRILTGRSRARTRDRQMIIWPTPRGHKSASVKECDGRLDTPDKTPGDLFSSFVSPPPPLRVRARPAEPSGCGRGRRACGRAAQPPSRPPTHPRIPRLRRLAARACHAPAPAADSRSDFGVACLRATGRC